MSKKPIFHDPENRREGVVKRVIFSLGLVLSVFIVTLIASILIKPILPLPQVFRDITTSKSLFHAKQGLETEKLRHPAHLRSSAMGTGNISQSLDITAFLVEWDDASFASLQDNINKIDTLISEELSVTDTGVTVLSPDKLERTLDFVKQTRPSLKMLPLVNNYDSKTDSWNTDRLHAVLSDAQKRKNLENSLLAFVDQHHFSGLSIDFEELADKTFPSYYAFLSDLATTLHDRGLILQVNVPLHNDSFDYVHIASIVDTMTVMAYDEHWMSAVPGSIAWIDWFRDGVGAILSKVPKDKVSIALGNYGYDWAKWVTAAHAVTFQEAHTLMRQSEGEVDFDGDSLNPHFSYTDDKNVDHEVWYLDAVTAYNQAVVASELGAGNISLWRLGSEDPSFWKLFTSGRIDTSEKPVELQDFGYGYEIEYTGNGELYKVTRTPQDGKRNITFEDGLITDENITQFPLPYEITKYGGTSKKKVVITFDDGPDPKYTPEILDILKAEKANATFFVVGEQAEKYPDILKRIYTDGQLIGSHTFTHPDISKTGNRRTDLELSITERLIESITGHATILFRPPYGEDVEPEYPSQIAPLLHSNSLGYITVGMKLDPSDWANPGKDKIIERTLTALDDERGNILLLHDSGGNRDQTVAALPELIRAIRAHGYEIVPLNDLVGLPRESMMPLTTGMDKSLSSWDAVTFSGIYLFTWFIYYVFVFGLAIGLFRLFAVVVFAFVQKFSREKTFNPKYRPEVAVIVPAYNEETVIARTIESLLQSNYDRFEVVVVDDGSKDGTYDAALAAAKGYSQVTVHTKENGGKGEAINYGITHSKAEIIIVIDADTLFDPDTIGLLARHFQDSTVGAVSWNVKVGNRNNLLTKMQAIEYITTQNLDRRAYDALNTITVVPGAVGAWRRSVVLEAGGFKATTLAEDSDLTIEILRLGHRIVHEDRAHAYTEAPEDWLSFAKQRFRWAFGIMQVTYKHIGVVFDRRASTALRFFVMPQMVVFQTIFPLLAPLIDLIAVISIIYSLTSYFLYGTVIYLDTVIHILSYAVLFIALDTIVGIIAFAFESNEDWKLLLYFPLQRFIYRFFMYFIQFRAIWSALIGRLIGWNKFARTNKAKVLFGLKR